MKVLNKIALVLGWLDIIALVCGAVYYILAAAISMAFLLIPAAVVIGIIVLIVKIK